MRLHDDGSPTIQDSTAVDRRAAIVAEGGQVGLAGCGGAGGGSGTTASGDGQTGDG